MKLSYKQFSKIRFKGRENKKRTKQIIYKISLLLKVTLNPFCTIQNKKPLPVIPVARLSKTEKRIKAQWDEERDSDLTVSN